MFVRWTDATKLPTLMKVVDKNINLQLNRGKGHF